MKSDFEKAISAKEAELEQKRLNEIGKLKEDQAKEKELLLNDVNSTKKQMEDLLKTHKDEIDKLNAAFGANKTSTMNQMDADHKQ
jgi:hypothetical protein